MKNNGEQETWDDIKIFTAKGVRIADPKINILSTAQILFNAAFVHRAGISDKSHVILGYSAANRAIIFQFTNDAQAQGALTIVKRGGGASVGTRSFFNYYELKPTILAGHYIPRKEKLRKIGEAWIISLDDKITKNV
jgi:hypothetical protein